MSRIQSGLTTFVFVLVMMSVIGLRPALAADPAGLDKDAFAALDTLYKQVPKAKELGAKAKGILVFPAIAKAGFIVGAQYGDGVLIENGQVTSNFNIAAASFGLQAGVQSFAYIMIMMSDNAMKHLDTGKGWELGLSPSIVIIDASAAKTMTTKTGDADVYAYTFGNKGLMAGGGLMGSKITRRSK